MWKTEGIKSCCSSRNVSAVVNPRHVLGVGNSLKKQLGVENYISLGVSHLPPKLTIFGTLLRHAVMTKTHLAQQSRYKMQRWLLLSSEIMSGSGQVRISLT